ncbi:MAG: hypothetical protein U9N35_02260 [Euryarchaeota archaeon]|nr:hypothetical protein [Euryarchaeota archaeon]
MKDLKKLQKIVTTKKSILSFLLFFLIFSYLAGITENYNTDKNFQRWIDVSRMEIPKDYPGFTPEGEEILKEYFSYLEINYNRNITCFSWIPYRSYYLYSKRSNYVGLLHATVGDTMIKNTEELAGIKPFDKIENAEKFKNKVKKTLLKDIDTYMEKPPFEYIDSVTPGIIDENLLYELYIDTQSNLKRHMNEGEYIRAFVDYKILENLDQYLEPQKEKKEPSVEYMDAFIHDLRISIPLTIAAWMLYLVCIMQIKIKEGNGVDRRFSTDNGEVL